MKVTKALLALAVMMVMIMPSCKKADLTKSSANPYVAVVKTGEELVGKDAETAGKLLTNAQWVLNDGLYEKKISDVECAIELRMSENGVVGKVECGIRSEAGRKDALSVDNYKTLLTMLGKSYTINSKTCDFARAEYYVGNDAKVITDYDTFKSEMNKFADSDQSGARWGEEKECSIAFTSMTVEGVYAFMCNIWDYSIYPEEE